MPSRPAINLSNNSSSRRTCLSTAIIFSSVEWLGLVRHSINNIIHAEFISLVRLFDRPERVVGKLPPITHVVIVIDRHHQTAGFVFEPPELRIKRIAPGVIHGVKLEGLDRKETVENRMRDVESLEFEFGKGQFHVFAKIFEILRAAKIIDQQKSSAQQIFTHPGDLSLIQ